MRIPAPYRKTVGTTTVTATLNTRLYGNPYYPTPAEAMSHAREWDSSLKNVWRGDSRRILLSNGRIGFNRFLDTHYASKYAATRSYGYDTVILYQKPFGYYPSTMPIVIGGVSGFGNYCSNTLGDIDPDGTGTSIEAIYNRLVVANLRNRAMAEARVKIADSKMDVAESLATLGQTVEMVAIRAAQVLRAYRAVRKGNLSAAFKAVGKAVSPGRLRNMPKNASHAWLELQYGWLPLMNDIIGGIELAGKVLSEPPNHFVVTRRVTEGLLVADPTTGASKAFEWSFDKEALASVEVKFRCKITDANLALLSGTGLLNPAQLAWNLLPFSFVVDWMLPVGTWLESMTSSLGVDVTSGYRTTRTWGSIHATAARKDKGYLSAQNARAKAWFGTISREAFTSLPGYMPYFRFPFSSNQRVASAIALIHSTRRG